MPKSITTSRPRVQRMAIMVAGITAVSIFSTAGLAQAAESTAVSTATASTATAIAGDPEINLSEQEVQQLEAQFSIIESIPDSVLQAGDDATRAYLILEGVVAYTGKGKEVTQPVPNGWWETAKCAAAIATFIGSNLVVASKLIKIKQYISALGGIKKAAGLMLRASTWSERLAIGGNALVGLAAEILGYSMIRNNC
ncbi:hypothetical protein [Streptomyces sp. AP-93]|uniref:hypothetical protein n=1 Tax=Streptomyces sp. AP-93 TaxID=2929048 RepID=UPI001FAFCB51|nr:hypothetical protein [Streptomyces sp. AP-93]MCJ0870826.1 hypothetical protein [Streptomyces sp. AP-93]